MRIYCSLKLWQPGQCQTCSPHTVQSLSEATQCHYRHREIPKVKLNKTVKSRDR